ncbi:MAG: FKBP-type peptidyl-prolyl cis-trans isomerase [Desulfurivibrio sp.]|nr:FKBP-type peptidyl-prolyl cis-trans isomerase [Desulfurivibrio sp.]
MTHNRQAQENDRVTVRYEGRLEDGELFESSDDSAPTSFKIGEQLLLPSLERAVIGMEKGQTRTVSIAPEEGYGPHHEELVVTVPRENLSPGELNPGAVVAMNLERDGQTHRLPAMVVEADEQQVKVDFNHPLAGQELFYTITLQALEPATTEDDD